MGPFLTVYNLCLIKKFHSNMMKTFLSFQLGQVDSHFIVHGHPCTCVVRNREIFSYSLFLT